MKKLKINNCHECPFFTDDNEWGQEICNIKEIELNYKINEQLPSNKVHDECPLKDNDYLITIK